MKEKVSLYSTIIVTIAIWTLLAWNYYHGGVPSHHILHREDLPSISNWWGGLLLPLLTWFLLYRIQKRLMQDNRDKSKASTYTAKNILYGFAGAVLFGTLLSILFILDYSNIIGFMFIGLILLALLVPIYRAECILGFVIAMTFTFGAVLPTAFGSLIALFGAILYLYIRPAILYLVSGLFPAISPKKRQSKNKN